MLCDNVPQSLEAEQLVLGSMLLESSAIEKVAKILRPEDFYRDAHRVIFEAILSLAERDESVDVLTLRKQLQIQDVLDNIGGVTYLSQLQNAVSSAAIVAYYAQLVEEKAIMRRKMDGESGA